VLRPNDRCWCQSGQKFKYCHQRATEPVRAGAIAPLRTVPDTIEKPEYAVTGVVTKRAESPIKPPDVLERMRRTCTAAADVLVEVGRMVAPGVRTDELDARCHELAIEAGAYPSPLGYGAPAQPPYPKSICTSVNEVICHGIPDDRELREGDIVNLDVTLFREGVHGDTNATFVVGRTDPESDRLVTVTRDCLRDAIAAVKPGEPLRVIGRAIQDHAEASGFSVVRDFIGHGVGEQFHTAPEVPHYDAGSRMELQAGMVFTIEPMIAVGSWRVRMWPDSWTAVTEDRKRTAQFEHTILVTDDGAEILTVPSAANTADHPFWSI
jgi:methionyl aminopeptidase